MTNGLIVLGLLLMCMIIWLQLLVLSKLRTLYECLNVTLKVLYGFKMHGDDTRQRPLCIAAECKISVPSSWGRQNQKIRSRSEGSASVVKHGSGSRLSHTEKWSSERLAGARIVKTLINSGTIGVLQWRLQAEVSKFVDGRTVNAYLHTLWAEGKVQHFELPSARGPARKMVASYNQKCWRSDNDHL